MWCGSCYSSKVHPDFFIAVGDHPQADADDEDRLLSGWIPRKSDVNNFTSGRNGDDLLVSFECDFCIFEKLFSRAPQPGCEKDNFALACIRRVNLDAFWSRARSTVQANTYKVREGLKISTDMGMSGPYLDPGPLPRHDHCGYEVAIQMVVSSLNPGRYSNSHKQWETIRRFRSCYSNQVRAAREANFTPLVLADNNGSTYQRLGVDPCGSMWFQRFMVGCSKRMGQDCRPNQALSIQLVHEIIRRVELKAHGTDVQSERNKWILGGTYFVICFVLSLRSPEGLMADLEGVIQFFDPDSDEVVVPLLGRFKGEHHVKQHLLTSCAITGSGLRVKRWMELAMAVHRRARRTVGPLFANERGYQSTTTDMNDLFIEILGEIYEECPKMFGYDITQLSDLSDKYNVFRSFRRGSESRAVAMKVSEADRYVVNRWKKKERAGTKKVAHSIDQHYVDVAMVKDSFVRYTMAM